MKIAIDISQIAYKGTGVASYTSKLVSNLLTIDQINDYLLFGISLRQQDILQNFFQEMFLINKKVSKFFCPIPQTLGNLIWNRFHIVQLEKLIGKIDIYHSSDWIQIPTAAKKITTVHDLIIYKYPEVSQQNIISTQKRRLNWVIKECNEVVADSQTTKSDIVKILKMDPEKIEVVYPGIGSEFKRQNEEEILRVKQKYGLLNDTILAVGTIEPRKNLRRVVEAFGRFSQHNLISTLKKPIDLVIVGNSGWDKSIIPGNHIKILGYVDPDDLPALYSGALFFIFPSLYEGFGLPVLEAMSCGCPVISSNRGSLKEITNNSSFLVDPEDEEDISTKMVQLFIDKNLYSDLIKKGYKQAKEFTWDKTARNILALYEKLYLQN